MYQCNVESSAKRSMIANGHVSEKGRSFMKIENRRGPRIEPWGTPDVILPIFEYFEFT